VKWRDGYFKFEAMEIPDHGEIGVDAREFLAQDGFNAHKIALELSRLADEARRTPAAMAVPTPPETAAPGDAASARKPVTDGGTPPSSSLGSILAVQPVTSLTAEATLEVLRAGAAVLSRGVLLLVERFGVTGVGQFGLGEGDKAVDEGIRNLWIPLDGASVLSDVVASGTTFRGPLPHNEVSRAPGRRARGRMARRGRRPASQGRADRSGCALRGHHAGREGHPGSRATRGKARGDRVSDGRAGHPPPEAELMRAVSARPGRGGRGRGRGR